MSPAGALLLYLRVRGMLKKQQRLTTEAFDRYFATGRRYHGQSVQLIFTPASSFHGAVVVGKKVYKRAVDRNQLRRRLYGLLYRYKQDSFTTGIFIVLVKPGAQQLPFTAVRDDVLETLAKLPIKQVQ